MKKVISMMMVVAMICLMAIPAMAAAQTKADLINEVKAKAPAEYQSQAIATIENMTEEQAAKVDVPAVKAEAKALKAKLDAGTLTNADIETARANVEAKTGVAIAVSNINISGGKVTATVTATVNGKTATSTYNPVNTDNSGSASNPGVIKTTGMNVINAAIVLAVVVAGVLGTAVLKIRKANACA